MTLRVKSSESRPHLPDHLAPPVASREMLSQDPDRVTAGRASSIRTWLLDVVHDDGIEGNPLGDQRQSELLP